MNNRRTKYSWINVLVTSIIVILFMLILKNVNPYASTNKSIFIGVNVVFLLISLGIIFGTVKANNSVNRTFKTVFTGILIVLLAGSSYALYLLDVVNVNIKDIVTQESKIEHHASFVVKKGNYQNIDQLSTKTVGLIESDEFIEGNILPTDELETLEFKNVKVKKYSSYPFLINALLKEDVDFISLPKDFNSLFMTDDQIAEDLDKLQVVHTFSGMYEKPTIISSNDINVTEVPFTMLIMGNDGGRTDSLMLASVNPQSMQITLTSIARDSYVPIACYPGQSRDKINHARTISRECTIDTVENLLDIKIDFFVEVSFQGLVDLVDALGTIPIDSPATFDGNVVRDDEIVGGVRIHEGLHDLNGDQVLAFVRERGSFENGDFQRQANQQHAIASLISTIAETRDVNTLLNLVKATGKNVETNLSVTQLIDLMNLALARMDNTFLNSSDIVTIYGNRITGQGTMMYSPEYGFELYYYVPYEGSIRDARALIDMNMRADGIMLIPKGFNYSAKDEYQPPTFGQEIYDEAVDPGIFNGAGPVEEVEVERPEVEKEDNGLVVLKELNGLSLNEATSYLTQYGFTFDIIEEIEHTSDKANDGITIVLSTTAGITMSKDDSHITLRVKKYVYQGTEEPEPDEETSEDSKDPVPPVEEGNNKPGGDKGNGN